ncbi:hypothetical protein IWZ00DRAFT_545081 [Phyllosticta capitalensis]|uniref:Uncharacterized protein n=1 Tax=Phyllosticta capitalensis TaxID=121624 RepID=A0ABR1YR98_9PEZI
MGNSFSRDKRKRRVFDEEQACAHLHSMNAESRHSFESAHDAKMRLAGNTSEKSWTEKIDSHAERAGAETSSTRKDNKDPSQSMLDLRAQLERNATKLAQLDRRATELESRGKAFDAKLNDVSARMERLEANDRETKRLAQETHEANLRESREKFRERVRLPLTIPEAKLQENRDREFHEANPRSSRHLIQDIRGQVKRLEELNDEFLNQSGMTITKDGRLIAKGESEAATKKEK